MLFRSKDSFSYDKFGLLVKETRFTAAGVLIEQDNFSSPVYKWHDSPGIQTEQRFNASGQLFEVDNLQNGFVTSASTYVNGMLSTQSQYASNHQLAQTINYAQDGMHVNEVDTYSYGLLSTQDFYSNTQLQVEVRYSADGLTVTESDNYFYTQIGRAHV